MFVVVALVLGFISLKDLKVELFPKMELPIAVVVTSYSGAAPQEVEELISKPIESAVGTLEGLDTIQSISQQSSSLVVIRFDFGRNINDALTDIREKIDQVSGMLPEGANDPMVMRIDPNATPVVVVSLTGAELSKLQDIAEAEVQPALERAKGVASAAITGGKVREIRVNLDEAMMTNYGVTGSQIVSALGAENRSISAGTVERGGQDVALRIVGEYSSVDDIKNTPITLANGEAIKVSDVALVEDTFKVQNEISKVNGQETLVFTIMKQSDANTVEVATEVQKVMENLNEAFKDRGLEMHTIMDTSTYITDSMDTIVNDMYVGGILAAIILLLFLRSFRTTLVIAISMPIAIISTFILMYFAGETLNVISMGGLALGVGMMVDSSIVILESIFKKRQEGMPLKEAASVGATELGPAVLASTLTTSIVFLPVVFVNGLGSQIFRPLALTVVFSQFASLVAALTLVPMISSNMLGTATLQMEGDEPKGIFPKLLKKVENIYGKVLERALKIRKTVITIVILSIIGSLALVPFIGFELMPSSDSGQVNINATLQSGAQLKETESVVTEINERLAKYKDIIKVNYVSIGGSSDGISPGSKNRASFMIQLVESSGRELTTKQFVAEVSKEVGDITGAEIEVSESNSGMSAGSPIQLEITGDNLDVLNDLAQQVVWLLKDIDGTLNVDSSVSEGKPEVQVVVNRELATAFGLSYQQVMNEISLAFNGKVATLYKEDGGEYDVTVSFPDESSNTIRDLETMTIRNSQGVNIPLSSVAELVQAQGPSQISRTNQTRAVNVTSDVIGRDLGSVSREIQAQLDKISLPDGYEIGTGGQSEMMNDAFGQLALALLLGIFLVYMIMAVQFESFASPFIIMFSVPTMIIGVLLGLFIMNQSFSLPAFIGLIMLSGIVVSNGILLVDYIDILRARGIERFEAIVTAGKSRLRPIFMTAATAVLAMVPLALGIGEGAESQQPMAVVVVFGLTASTIFTLVFVPVMYIVIDNMSNRFKGLFKRDKSKKPKQPNKRKWTLKRAKTEEVNKELEPIGGPQS